MLCVLRGGFLTILCAKFLRFVQSIKSIAIGPSPQAALHIGPFLGWRLVSIKWDGIGFTLWRRPVTAGQPST